MNVEKVGLLLAGAVAVAVAAVGKIYWSKKEKEEKEKEERQRKEQLKKEITDKIINLKKEFNKEALSYSIKSLLLESPLSREKQKELLSSYEEVFSQPIIKWKNFTVTGEEGNILDELLKEEIKNFSDKNNYTLKDSFKFMLLAEAEQEAKAIIEEEEKRNL